MNNHLIQITEDKENNIPTSKARDSLSLTRRFGTELIKQNTSVKNVISSDPAYLEYYANDIYTYLHSIEYQNIASFGYLKIQTDINEKMRSILVDWLAEVHLKFKLVPETLFLTINILDRYLEKLPITRNRLQLVGVSSLLIACKYEEIYAPELHDFVYITDNSYSKEDIISMENSILKTLSFNISTPSSYRFLERYCKITESTDKQFFLARYFMELTLGDYKMLKYSRSMIAASSLYLVHKVTNIDPQ